MTCSCEAADRMSCDISVAIGDTIGANNVPGRWVTVYSGCTVKSPTMPRRGIWYCRPENDPDGGVTGIYFTAIVCNYTTGEGCEPAKPPRPTACKFYHREAFNGYEREFGAETLPELYALMAAAGVRADSTADINLNQHGIYPSWRGADRTPTSPPADDGRYREVLGCAARKGWRINEMTRDPHIATPSAFDTSQGGFFGVPTIINDPNCDTPAEFWTRVANGVGKPQTALLEWERFTTGAAAINDVRAARGNNDDPDPQPSVVGS